MPYDFSQGDTASVLRIYCKDEDNEPLDLSGSTISLRWRLADGTLAERDMTIVDQSTKGVAEYQFDTDELQPPKMTFTVRVTNISSGKYVTSNEKLVVTVRALM